MQNHGSSEATIYNIGEPERGPVMDITVPARGTSGAQYIQGPAGGYIFSIRGLAGNLLCTLVVVKKFYYSKVTFIL